MQSSDIEIRIGEMQIVTGVPFAHHELVDLLVKPECLLHCSGNEIVKDQKKVKVVHTRFKVNGETFDCYVKEFKMFSFRKKLETLFIPSRARKAWSGAKRLLAAGIKTAEPVAAIEHRKFGFVKSSYFISRTIPDAEISVDYFRKTFPRCGECSIKPRRAFLRSFAGAFRRLHEANIYHNDLKDYNILVSSGGEPGTQEFWFLDVDCVSLFRGMTKGRRIKNLIQLSKTLGQELTMADKMEFFKEYFGVEQMDGLTREQKRIINRVLRRSGPILDHTRT